MKPAANRSPAPVASTNLSIGAAGTASLLSRETTTQPFSLRVTTASLTSLRSAAERGVEIGGLVQALQLALVGEDEIDRAGAHQVEELVAIAVDAERIRERQRDDAAGAMRDLGRLAERVLRVRRIPQIAFQIDDAGGRDLRLRRGRRARGSAPRPDRCSWCARRPASPARSSARSKGRRSRAVS